MKPETLMDAIGGLDDRLLTEAVQPRRRTWVRWIAVAAAICLTISAVWLVPHYMNNGVGTTQPGDTSVAESELVSGNDEAVDSQGDTADGDVLDNEETESETDAPECLMPMGNVLAKAVYPKMPAYQSDDNWGSPEYTAWRDAVQQRRDLLTKDLVDLTGFYADTMGAFLTDTAGKNRVYSPLNVYLALSMLAETADGDSRRQLLDLLGVKDTATLQERCDRLWNGTYRDDGAVTCRLANSMWLADDITYKQTPLDTLAERYYASAFSGKMGSAEYTALLQEWLNEQTGGLLEQQASGIDLLPETVMTLASTIYFSARWTGEFSPENTKTGEFVTPKGKKTVEYMHQKTMDQLYYGENYTAFAKTLDGNNYIMWLVLPEKGVTPEQLAGDSRVVDQVTSYGLADGWYGNIQLTVPKFDVVSEVNLVSGLEKLGVTEAFDGARADFSPLLDDPAYVDEMRHAARVKVDEEGCTATAYTVTTLRGSAAPPEEVREFTLDRPFLFAITGPGDTLLFTGIVNEP